MITVIEGRKQYRIDRNHRTGGSAGRKTIGAAGITIGRIGDHVPTRPLDIYQAIGAQLAIFAEQIAIASVRRIMVYRTSTAE